MPLAAVDPAPLVHKAVSFLRSRQLDPGDRVLTLLDNDVPSFALGVAAMLEGVVQVPVPPDLAPPELAEIVDDADPALIVATDSATAVPDPNVDVVTWHTGMLEDLRPEEPSSEWPRTRPMAYTSGTTGRRKGVHVGIHDPEWGEAAVTDELEAFEGRHGERHLVVSPLYHSGPFRFAAVTALTGGEIAVLPRFDADLLRSALRELRPTSLFCVPTHLHRLLALPDVRADDLASLRLLAHAGAPCPVGLKERILELAPEGSVWEFYGSTEGQFTVCSPATWRRSPGSVGVARPGRGLSIRDADPRTDVGTIWVTAPWHARWEYWRDPDATTEAWDGERFTVGDLGHLDGDHLHLDGRPGDLVISGGVNVYPAEVERALLEEEAVAEAVSFGVADDEWGERVVAAVIPWPGSDLDPEALRTSLRARLAPPKVPKQILVVDELPRTPTGKVRRVGLGRALGL